MFCPTTQEIKIKTQDYRFCSRLMSYIKFKKKEKCVSFSSVALTVDMTRATPSGPKLEVAACKRPTMTLGCVQVCFLMLRRQSGTLSLTKSGHPTPSHSSNHHLKLISFSSPTDCVGGGEGGEVKIVGEREGERDRERERELVVYRKVRVFFSHLYRFM